MKIPEKYSKMLGTNENELIEMVSELTEKEIKELLTLLISAKNREYKLEIEFIKPKPPCSTVP
ncbi:hypothetical protein D5282_25160 [bacterium 1xD8-48]|nr:hypothetical protein [bacterium 1xD8-48]